MTKNVVNANNNANGDDDTLLIIGVVAVVIIIIVVVVLVVIYKKKKKNNEFSEYSDYANMTPAQLAATETQAASDFYSWNQSQIVPLTGTSTPGALSSTIPINVPHLIAMLAAGLTLDPGTLRAELNFIRNRSMQLGRAVACRAATACAKMEVRLGERLAVRLGLKAAARALTVAATRLATSLAVKATTAAATGPAAPFVFIAEFAFQAVLGFLDQFGVGGYTEIVPTRVYEGMRDECDRFAQSEFAKDGYEWPVIAGPLDKMSQSEYETKLSAAYDSIFDDPNHPATALFLTLYRARRSVLGRELNTAEVDTLLTTQDLGKSIDQAAFTIVANQAGGKVVSSPTGNLYCSYTTQAATDSSYHWPLTDEYENDIYSEWNPTTQISECRSSYMRTFSEQLGNGCTYNKDTRLPNITEAFCRSNGLDYSNGACQYAEGQEIAEMIFGKTFIRGLTQVFDPQQYKSCPEMDFCQNENCIDDGYFCRISRLAYMREPSDMQCKSGYEKSSPGFCKKECPTDSNGKWKMYGGLCYHPKVDTNLLSKVPTYGACPTGDGWRTEPVTCFLDARCTTGTSSCASRTPNWWPVGGGRCQAGVVTTCNDGPKSQPRPKSCPEGYRDNGAGMCEAVSRPIETPLPIDQVGECPAGKEREGLLCYDPCPANYTKITGGLWCSPNDGFKVKIRAKERKVAFSTPDFANSPVGQRVQQIKEAGQSGDIGRLAAGLACLSLATNPIVNGFGLQDLTNMIPDPATGQGVQQT
jgi:hypothetical protein